VDGFDMIAARLAGSVHALGGGGLAHLIIRLFIWREIWRFIRLIWHIQTFGPWIVGLIVAVIIGLIVWRKQRGQRPRAGADTGPQGW
jgi:hypothetical protein